MQSELGSVSKNKLDKVINIIRKKLNFNQWNHTTDVINWFSKINIKNECTFTQYDINDFYPLITSEILVKTIEFGKIHLEITENTIRGRIIKHCRNTLLYFNKKTWKKKNTRDTFM